MPTTRRDFLSRSAAGLAAAASATTAALADSAPAGTPPAFGTAAPSGPAITAQAIAASEKLMQVTLTAHERQQAARSWASSMAGLMERRAGTPAFTLGERDVPYSTWDPCLPGCYAGPAEAAFAPRPVATRPLPRNDADIAYAAVTDLSYWIHAKLLSCERLTQIYLERMARFDPLLHCVINLNPRALETARRLDAELAAGHDRGPLHGIPYGAKDLLDTRGLATTWGAEPFRHRVPDRDAAVIGRLEAAGAVLLAKLSLGALALNDVWFGGTTRNPWALEEGSSGSSAGPGAATAAGLVGFSIGSETGGSIVSPTMRCGITGLRPTFGRVPRTGAMTLCWSLDKLGPMTRTVEDAMVVLAAIHGADAGDRQSRQVALHYDAQAPVRDLRVGYFPHWMDSAPATDVDRAALRTLESLGLTTVPVRLPDWPYNSLNTILFAESAAAFEEITLNHAVDTLHEQSDDAWPNTFRQSRFLSAVDFVQADRLRLRTAQAMSELFNQVDLLLVPSLRDEMLTISNHTGHPSLTLRAGFVSIDEARSDWAPNPHRPAHHYVPPRRVPYGITLIGRLYDEGLIGRVGLALEQHLKVWDERPPGF